MTTDFYIHNNESVMLNMEVYRWQILLLFTVMKCSDSVESVLCFICELIRFGHDHFYMACCYDIYNCRFSLFYIHNKDTEMINMKVDRQNRLLFLLLFSVQIQWREFCPSPDDVYTLIHSRDNKLSWVVGHIPWECWMLPGGEYSDLYISHLVLYISHDFDRCTILFIKTY